MRREEEAQTRGEEAQTRGEEEGVLLEKCSSITSRVEGGLESMAYKEYEGWRESISPDYFIGEAEPELSSGSPSRV